MPVKIERTLDEFVEVVKKKLRIKQRQGYSGWEDPYCIHTVQNRLKKNIKDEDWVDVAACVMILWNLQRLEDQ